MKILIDTNILLDFLTKREPYYSDAEKILSMCIENKIYGCIAAHSVMNIFYILRTAYTLEQRRKLLLHLCDILEVIEIDKTKIINSLHNANFADVEDCLQTECAINYQADYIVTRNIRDFKKSSIPAILPEDFIKLVK
ncbi:MAG: PIN domain-containing protein [Oscillospiraceae bacterium]|nr:PIN domain-containing protein [Oscillospiraceae bacterium]